MNIISKEKAMLKLTSNKMMRARLKIVKTAKTILFLPQIA